MYYGYPQGPDIGTIFIGIIASIVLIPVYGYFLGLGIWGAMPREIKDLVKTLRRPPLPDEALESLIKAQDLPNANGLTIQILAAVAEDEARRISEPPPE
jgi:hypothetical protein